MTAPSPDGASSATAVLAALEVRNLTPLLEDVCRRRGVVREELCGRARTSSVSRARQEALVADS